MTASAPPLGDPPPLPFDRHDPAVVGVPVEVVPGVRRVLCGNPGPFTFTGTSTWLVGEREVAVIDPGPADRTHLEAVLAAVSSRGGRVSHILCTHTHADHSPGALELRRRTGAPTVAFGPHPRPRPVSPGGPEEGADRAFVPDRVLRDGETVRGEGWVLEALHTPGHIANHLCFALVGTGVVFTGDHVMGWSTSVISPRDGDLADYYASLQRLLDRGDHLHLSAHGPPIRAPHAYVEALAAHRRFRDAQVLALLSEGVTDVPAMVERLYVGLDARLVKAAQATVVAHLIRQVALGVVASDAPTPGALSVGTRFWLS